MRKSIVLQNKKIDYTLRKSKRARRVSITVHHDGAIVATVPYYLGEKSAERFIIEKGEWLVEKRDYFKEKFDRHPILKHSRDDYLKFKEDARKLAEERTAYYGKLYGFKYDKISIRNQRTRWGSCSKKGNLNFNYKIFFLPERMRDYIIVHELCHLKEFNHSKRFWDLVAKAIPEYREIKKKLTDAPL